MQQKPGGGPKRKVRKDLIEQIQQPGAYCQDYETFKGIYRFLARGIIRSGQKVCVSLITVVDGEGESPGLHERDTLMEQLGEIIRAALRVGDGAIFRAWQMESLKPFPAPPDASMTDRRHQ